MHAFQNSSNHGMFMNYEFLVEKRNDFPGSGRVRKFHTPDIYTSKFLANSY